MNKKEKPWGWELLLEKNDKYVLKKLFMKKGECCSLQYHKNKHETIYVLSGVLRIQHGDNRDKLAYLDLNPNDIFVCPNGCVHRMIGAEDCVYLEASTPEMDDIIRLEDNYGRLLNEI